LPRPQRHADGDGHPPGAKMTVARPTPENYRKARTTIPKVKRPDSDPVFGDDRALMRLWK
jgi:uncharacterized protein YjlB